MNRVKCKSIYSIDQKMFLFQVLLNSENTIYIMLHYKKAWKNRQSLEVRKSIIINGSYSVLETPCYKLIHLFINPILSAQRQIRAKHCNCIDIEAVADCQKFLTLIDLELKWADTLECVLWALLLLNFMFFNPYSAGIIKVVWVGEKSTPFLLGHQESLFIFIFIFSESL